MKGYRVPVNVLPWYLGPLNNGVDNVELGRFSYLLFFCGGQLCNSVLVV